MPNFSFDATPAVLTLGEARKTARLHPIPRSCSLCTPRQSLHDCPESVPPSICVPPPVRSRHTRHPPSGVSADSVPAASARSRPRSGWLPEPHLPRPCLLAVSWLLRRGGHCTVTPGPRGCSRSCFPRTQLLPLSSLRTRRLDLFFHVRIFECVSLTCPVFMSRVLCGLFSDCEYRLHGCCGGHQRRLREGQAVRVRRGHLH